MIITILAAFLTSLITILIILRFNEFHLKFSGDFDLTSPQKFHKYTVPRIGGIGIFFSLLIAIALMPNKISASTIEINLLLSSIPAFAIGVVEDLTKSIRILPRFLFIILSAILFVYLLSIQITSLDIPYLDIIFSLWGVGAVFTVFAITGLTNAYNLIDGFNGLASMTGILTLLVIALASFLVNDMLITHLCLAMVGSLSGFFIFNYPKGNIFLGDGGAYLIGFWIAGLSVLFAVRHQEISPWFCLVVNIYPITETLFTIYRRIIHQGISPGKSDGLHLHTLIYRRLIIRSYQIEKSNFRNSRTAPYLWLIAVLGMLPAILWPQSSKILMFFSLIFIVCYVLLYVKIVKVDTRK